MLGMSKAPYIAAPRPNGTPRKGRRITGQRLIATTLFCFSLGTPVGQAANDGAHKDTNPKQIAGAKDVSTRPAMQVLSPVDEELYRAAFKAIDQKDWNKASALLGQIGDKRLQGYVLAGIYEGRGASLTEYNLWLKQFGDLPQAAALYSKASHLPGVTRANLANPASNSAWSSGDWGHLSAAGFATTGFRSDADLMTAKTMPAVKKQIRAIEHALHDDDAAKAESLLHEAGLQNVFEPAQYMALTGKIAANYFYNHQPNAALRLLTDMEQQDTAHMLLPQMQWIEALSYWSLGDMPAAATHFTRLASQTGLPEGDRATAAFWAYRAHKRNNDNGQAYDWLRQAAQYQHSFYGILALHLMGHTPKEDWAGRMPGWSGTHLATMEAIPAGRRAMALIQIGQNDMAATELNTMPLQGQRRIQEAMLALSEAAHMPSLTLRLGGLAVNDNGKAYDAALYPLPPWQPAMGFTIERALMYALVRHESQFDPTAVSERGACGLMQLMPDTARLVASKSASSAMQNIKLGDSDDCPRSLMDPSINLALGQDYVQRLAAQPHIGDNLLYLLAAYNSGPARLSRWFDLNEQKDPLLFLESMPVRETRDYVQQVLIQYWMYRTRLKQPLQSLEQLARGEWPHYDAKPGNNRPGREAAADGIKVASADETDQPGE